MINELRETNKQKVQREEEGKKRERELMLKDMEGAGKRGHQNSPEADKIYIY